jgi:hypothetical protein
MIRTDIGWRARRGNSGLGAIRFAGPARALREARTIVMRPALSTISGLHAMDLGIGRAVADEAPPERPAGL